MTQIRYLNTQIYKNIAVLLSAFIILGSTYNTANAVEFGEVKYNNTLIDYSKIDKLSTQKLADYYFDQALKAQNPSDKKDFLQKASGEYFILSQIEPHNLYPLVQLARVYDFENKNSYSKAYFFRALKIDKQNAQTNYYFGEYYYTREDYIRALYYYNKAFENGFHENYKVLIKMAIMYEKLGDLLRANQYYKKAFLVSPNNAILPEKIREIESLQYKNSGYYTHKRKK